MLVARGHRDVDAAKSFLRPLLSGLHDPRRLRDADAAAERIARAVRDGERVAVHGDYDADGIAGAALLASWIRDLGGRAVAFVPERLAHGYDLSRAGVEWAGARGASLLVTVDCGVRALDAVDRAVAAGMDVVVTDHHPPGPALPRALAVVDPHRADCGYPNKRLCGAGVAFKVGQIVAELLGRDEDEAWPRLDLVALATIADQVGLEGENRILARYGLRAAARTRRVGLRALLGRAGIDEGEPLDAQAIAFQVAPRINAAGRVGRSASALRLLLSSREAEACALADELETDNAERRALERRTTEDALSTLGRRYDPDRDMGVVVAGDGWHPGVVGIVASRIVGRVFRPAVVIGMDGDRGRGSARSIPGFDLLGAISKCGEHLSRFGGHRQAAGLEIRRDRLDRFREAFAREAKRRLGPERPKPALGVDAEVDLADIGAEFHRVLRHLGPFGRGNPEPVFVARGVRVAGRVRALKGSHLGFRMASGGSRLDAIAFNLAERRSPADLEGRALDVAFSVLKNTYRGRTSIQARVLDARTARPATATADPGR